MAKDSPKAASRSFSSWGTLLISLSLIGAMLYCLNMELPRRIISRHSISLELKASLQEETFVSKAPPVGEDFCRDSWVLSEIDETKKMLVESTTRAWYDNLPTTLRTTFTSVIPEVDVEGDSRFNIFLPTVDACKMQRIGGSGDGGKLICGLSKIPEDLASSGPKCTVYSLGSNGEFSFEEDLVKRTPCNVEIFDCFTDVKELPATIKDRARYHKICLGNPALNKDPSKKFMTLKQIMEMLGHKNLHLLKMDIEGSEFELFDEMLKDISHLPDQISFEMHYWTHMPVDWQKRRISSGELAILAERLYLAGYRSLSREKNPAWGHCSEFTLARFLCPVNKPLVLPSR